MFPSTKGSTLGGFLAGGSGGTGSLRFGTNADGYVRALDVAACDGGTSLRPVTGADTIPFVHAYGTTGVIARATVGLDRAHDWVGVFAAFDDYASTVAAMRALAAELVETPRLISADEAAIVAALPPDKALDPRRLSLRAIIDAADVDSARTVVARLGGQVLDVRSGVKGADRVSSLSFNHTTFHLQRRRPDYWFHLEVGGDALGDDPDAVKAVYDGTVLHLELMRDALVGMVMAPYRGAADVYRGMADLEALGIGIHSPHTWILDRRIDGIRAVLTEFDPRGLLNPGKLRQN
jgi:FAD/FMN-containing dehydrogenase